MTEHTNKQFDEDLEAIRSRMLAMGGLVESQIRTAIAGYLAGDGDRARKVIADDAKVNELELAIDNELGHIIVRRQPAALGNLTARVHLVSPRRKLQTGRCSPETAPILPRPSSLLSRSLTARFLHIHFSAST